jgi:hypothetical protein
MAETVGAYSHAFAAVSDCHGKIMTLLRVDRFDSNTASRSTTWAYTVRNSHSYIIFESTRTPSLGPSLLTEIIS